MWDDTVDDDGPVGTQRVGDGFRLGLSWEMRQGHETSFSWVLADLSLAVD
jgi:hypothetical protein